MPLLRATTFEQGRQRLCTKLDHPRFSSKRPPVRRSTASCRRPLDGGRRRSSFAAAMLVAYRGYRFPGPRRKVAAVVEDCFAHQRHWVTVSVAARGSSAMPHHPWLIAHLAQELLVEGVEYRCVHSQYGQSASSPAARHPQHEASHRRGLPRQLHLAVKGIGSWSHMRARRRERPAPLHAVQARVAQNRARSSSVELACHLGRTTQPV